MAKPSDKTPEMERAIDSMSTPLGIKPRRKSIEANICTTCSAGAPPESFRNAISQKEYTISGMCQACQDSVFGKD